MATQKAVRILYQAKNNTTGLADVKAQVYLNGVAKAVGGSALVLTEVDATNSPGLYELLISGATLTGYGVAAGSYNCLEGYIDSASKSAKAPFREELTVANTDDIDSKLGTPASASVSADIAAVKADTAAIKVDLESGPNSLATILANIQTLQNASIGNGVGFVLPMMIIPGAGSNTYKIPITINNNDGALIDPTSNLVTVGVLNAAGTDRGAYLTGSSGSPATVAATRDSVGQYHVVFVLPSTAVEEDLLFSFAYTVGANAMVRYGQAQTLADFAASGFALQSTLLDVQGDVDAIEAVVTDPTFGNAAIEALLVNGTYGLSALQAQAASGQGIGFVTGTDSLHAISGFLIANLFQGGRAV